MYRIIALYFTHRQLAYIQLVYTERIKQKQVCNCTKKYNQAELHIKNAFLTTVR